VTTPQLERVLAAGRLSIDAARDLSILLVDAET
jgi:hypothetical protein